MSRPEKGQSTGRLEADCAVPSAGKCAVSAHPNQTFASLQIGQIFSSSLSGQGADEEEREEERGEGEGGVIDTQVLELVQA